MYVGEQYKACLTVEAGRIAISPGTLCTECEVFH